MRTTDCRWHLQEATIVPRGLKRRKKVEKHHQKCETHTREIRGTQTRVHTHKQNDLENKQSMNECRKLMG
jgi:hypothetical protein